MTMRRRDLGTHGPSITPIGLGLAALGRPGYLNLGHGQDLPEDRSVVALERHTHTVLDRAYELGVRFFDTARSYGRGEAFLGSWLQADPARAADVTIGSKWGYTYTADWQVDVDQHEVKDHTLPTFERQIAETRSHLGDHLAIEQIHSATLDSGVLARADVLDALSRLADEGVLIGLSLTGPEQARTLERALELTALGRAPFRCVQATWNLLEPSVGRALTDAHEAGWGVVLKEVVANGRLTPGGEVPRAVRAVADAHDTGPDAVAIAAALAQPFTSAALSGATTVAQLESNLAAAELTLHEDELAMLAQIAEPAERYWSTRSDLPWT
jgi:aryl-alcohol dehydrogenase-like predicted oxidoreductase